MSQPLGKKLSEKLNDAVDELLGRAKELFVPPIVPGEIKRWWEAMIDDEIVAAARLMKKNYPNLDGHTNGSQQCRIDLAEGPFLLTLQEQLLNRPHAAKTPVFSEATLYTAWLKAGLDGDRWDTFKGWMLHTATIQFEFVIAKKVCKDLIAMSGTIGQLNRILPELADYLPTNLQRELREQKRASNAPFEWAPYDKEKVEICKYSLAKAHLMPIGNRRGWEHAVSWCHRSTAE